jgi:integrase
MLKKIDGTFHLDFTFKGKRYRVDSGRVRLRDAETFEANFRKQIAEKWEQEQIEKEKKELYSKSKLSFKDAWDLFYLNEYSGCESKHITDTKVIFMDLADYANSKNYKYFDVPTEVLQDYMNIVLDHGTFEKFKKGKNQGNSTSSYNKKLHKLKYIYKVVCKVCKVANPIDDVRTKKSDAKDREPFSMHQIEQIKATQSQHFMFPVFFIGIHTGLRLNDIIDLKWSDIKQDVLNGFKYFHVVTHKTNTEVEPPLINGMEEFLSKLDKKSEFILPEHNKLYYERQSELTYRFHEMIENVIPKEEIYEERERGKKHCKLDIHSLRHTYAFIAAINNVPGPIVQSILGHTTMDMTNHYQQHSNREVAFKQLSKMTFELKEKVNVKDELMEKLIMLNKDNLDVIKHEMFELLKQL